MGNCRWVSGGPGRIVRGIHWSLLRPAGAPHDLISVGSGPFSIVITPDSKTVYVASTGGGAVTPISTATNQAGKPVKVGKSRDRS
jgi:hypothetical protein